MGGVVQFDMASAAEIDREHVLEGVKRAAGRVPSVQLAYVFGSRMENRARLDSDLDIAVAFAPGMDASARGAAKLALIDGLTAELGALGERADLVDLERAGVSVAFRAIRDGRCVYSRDRRRKVELVARIARLYDDEAPKRALFTRAAIEAARRMGAEAKRG